MTILNVFFLLAYVLSATVQYNDPDGLLWIAVYTSAAAMCLAWHLDRLPRALPLTLLAITGVWAGALLPRLVGEVSVGEIVASITMQTKAVEEAREIGGLLLVALWAAVLSWHPAR